MDDFLDDECADDLEFPDDSFGEARSNDWVANNGRTQSMTVPDPRLRRQHQLMSLPQIRCRRKR